MEYRCSFTLLNTGTRNGYMHRFLRLYFTAVPVMDRNIIGNIVDQLIVITDRTLNRRKNMTCRYDSDLYRRILGESSFRRINHD